MMGLARKPIIVALMLSALLTGCTTVGPDFVPPSQNAVLPDQWSSGDHPDVSLQDTTSIYAVNSKIGMVLPYDDVANSSDKIQVWYAHSDAFQNATVLKTEVNKQDFAFENYAFKTLVK